jgi:ADP-heptose:LPS heptosyltransferase
MKYDLMYNFCGGLGDIILQLFSISQYDQILENAKKGKRIIINLCSANPFAKELFDNLPNKQNIKINIFDYFVFSKLNKEERSSFFIEKNKEQIDLNIKYDPERREKNGHVDFLLSDEEYELIDSLVTNIQKENKKLIIFSPCTGKKTTTPTKEYCNQVIDYISDDFVLVKIGRDYSLTEIQRYDREYIFNHKNVKDLTNKLSVPATLELVKRGDGIIASDSSIMCYGSILDKPMFIMISDKNKEHYKNYNQYIYYKCFDRDNVVYEDWQNTDQESVNNFLKLL